MENKNVGLLIVGISIVTGLIIFIFNSALKNIVGQTCTHGSSCSMYDTISTQTYLSLAIATIIFIIGLVIMFTKPKERIVFKKIKERKKKLNLKGLNEKEKKVVELLGGEGTMFQAELMEKIRIGKVGMTRLLDKLEAKQIIERKRRGMNNIVILRN
jgi:uncharacterized membrane protein